MPEDKIVSRYYRSLDLLSEAIGQTHRAYPFDNSGTKRLWIAEVTEGRVLTLKTELLPAWAQRYVLDKIA